MYMSRKIDIFSLKKFVSYCMEDYILFYRLQSVQNLIIHLLMKDLELATDCQLSVYFGL